jgi:Flp pilus assembly protein TadG
MDRHADQRHSHFDGARAVTGSRRLLGLRRLGGTQDGAAATEFAIVFPAFFLLLFGMFEIAHGLWVINTLQFALAQGARYAMTSGAVPPTAAACASGLAAYEASVQADLRRQLAAYLSSATVPLPTGTCTAGSPSTVTLNLIVTYNFNFILTSLGPIALQQTATVTTPIS